MRIQSFVSDLSSRFTETAPSSDVRAPQAASPATSSAADSSSHVPSSELADLVGLLQQQPTVRQDVLNQVAQRLANGDYDTPAAAQQTAAAILQAPE